MTRIGKKTDEYKSVFGNARRGSDSVKGVADWSSADSKTLLDLIAAVTGRGGAVRFGYTRDGGAYSLGLYYGTESTTEYCRPGEDLGAFLSKWAEFYRDLDPISKTGA